MNIDSHLQCACAAVRAAGEYILSQLPVFSNYRDDLGRDIKLSEDRGAEEIILETITSMSDTPVLSEETGLIGKVAAEEYLWIVDPLDGTYNFFRGIPFFCSSVALWKGGKPVLGVIYDPLRRELFTAVVGQGAWLNGQSIAVRTIVNRSQAAIAIGFPVQFSFTGEEIESFVAKVQGFKKLRLLGSAALSLAYVACGRVDAYMEKGIMLWDVAAGLALVVAAGGDVRFVERNEPLYSCEVAGAANAMILDS